MHGGLGCLEWSLPGLGGLPRPCEGSADQDAIANQLAMLDVEEA
jgi:hypothetical protein